MAIPSTKKTAAGTAKSARARSTTSKAKTTAMKPKSTVTRTTADAKPKGVPAPTPRTSVFSDNTAAMSSPEMKKQELLQKVVTRSQIKKKDAKPVVEAMLAVLGEALADGRELNLQPFGKVKLNRTKEMANARVIIAKIRQSKNTETAASPSEGSSVKTAAE